MDRATTQTATLERRELDLPEPVPQTMMPTSMTSKPPALNAQPYAATYPGAEPTRAEVDALPGATLLEFGASWCGVCAGTQPLLVQALAGQTRVRHLKVEDGQGRRLGRSYGVKLWPTLVFLRDGQEVARLVRPGQHQPIAAALEQIQAVG